MNVLGPLNGGFVLEEVAREDRIEEATIEHPEGIRGFLWET
jgi:hypothetical protein